MHYLEYICHEGKTSSAAWDTTFFNRPFSIGDCVRTCPSLCFHLEVINVVDSIFNTRCHGAFEDVLFPQQWSRHVR